MKKKLQKICNFFDLGSIEKIEKAGGNANDNFFVKTAKGEYLVKIVLEQYGVEDKRQEQLFLKHLEENTFPIVPYISSSAGEFINQEDDQIALVQRRIKAEPPAALTEDVVSQLGSKLAELHKIPYEGLPNKKHWLRQDYLQKTSEIIKEEFADIEDLQHLIEIYENIQTQWSELPQGIIHGDLILDNTLFKNGKLVAFIDWEEVGVGSLLLDFGMAVTSCCFRQQTFDENLYGVFYQAYSAERQFITEEMENITTAVRYAAITSAIWRFLNNNHYHPEGAINERYKLFWKQGFDKWQAPNV